MTFDQAQATFRTHKNHKTDCIYLAVASRRKAAPAISKDTFFDAVGEVASWLSTSDEHLLDFEVLRQKVPFISHRVSSVSASSGRAQATTRSELWRVL